MLTIIRFCSCNHPDQDDLHGIHQRVHNCGGTETRPIARCTVCGNVVALTAKKEMQKGF